MCSLEGKLKRSLWKLTQLKFLELSENNLCTNWGLQFLLQIASQRKTMIKQATKHIKLFPVSCKTQTFAGIFQALKAQQEMCSLEG